MSLEMTRGPLAEREESGDFRGGAGGRGGVNSFCKNTERGTEMVHTGPADETVETIWSDLDWSGFGILELGQSILLGVIAVQHKAARRSVG